MKNTAKISITLAIIFIFIWIEANSASSDGANHFLAAFIVPIILFIIFFFAKRKAKKIEAEMDEDDFIIRQPQSSLVIYIIITFLFSPLAIIMIASGDANFVSSIVYIFFALFGPFFIILWQRYKIIIKGNHITSTSYFGKTKSFDFDYITKVEQGAKKTNAGPVKYVVAYHENEKLFTVKDMCPGFNVLLLRLEKCANLTH